MSAPDSPAYVIKASSFILIHGVLGYYFTVILYRSRLRKGAVREGEDVSKISRTLNYIEGINRFARARLRDFRASPLLIVCKITRDTTLEAEFVLRRALLSQLFA